MPWRVRAHYNQEVFPKILEIQYIDAYKKGLDARQAAVANKKYKSHRKIGLPGNIIASIPTEKKVMY